MNDFGAGLAAIAGLIVSVAIISVIVSRKSGTPQLVQATGSALANVIAAAVAPAGNVPNNGNNGTNAFTLPSISNLGQMSI